MTRMYLAIIAGLLLMVPIVAGAAYAADTTKSPPPIGQMLVREGDYSVKLAVALKVGPASTEADAESALAAIGIAPESGWISDFPVTPDIMAELQGAIDSAAGSGKLTMGKAEAYSAFMAINAEAGLTVTPAAPGAKITEYDPEGNAEAPAYDDQAALDSYYTDEGPPVVTYYAPPPDYAYLYAWDPFPFWCGGFFFPGFFVLNDFAFFADFDHFGHRHHFHNREFGHNWHGHGMISNHVRDGHTGRTASIDPVTRHQRSGSRAADVHNGGRGGRGGFDRSSASNIVGRSGERGNNTFTQRGGVMTRRDNSVVGTGRGNSSGREFSGNRGRSSGFGSRSVEGSRSSGGSVRSFQGSRSFNGGASVRSFGGGGRSFDGGGSMRSFGGGGGGHSFGGGRSSDGGGGRSFGGGGGGGHGGGGGGRGR